MKLPKANGTGLTMTLSSGSHADRELYYLVDDDGKVLKGLYKRAKRGGGVYLTPIHEDGVLALRDSNHKGVEVYRIAEFVPFRDAVAALAFAGFHQREDCNAAG